MKQVPPLVAGQLQNSGRRYAATRGHPTESGRTLSDSPEPGDVLRGIPHDEARFRSVGSGHVTGAVDAGGEKGSFVISSLGNTKGALPGGSSEKDHRLPRNLRCGDHDRVSTGRSVHAVGVLESKDKGNLAMIRARITSNLQTYLRAPRMEDKRDRLHSFRVGGAASHHIDGSHGRSHGVLRMEVCGRSRQIRRSDGITGDVNGN